MRSATHSAMMARRGSQQIAPMSPVKVIRGLGARCGWPARFDSEATTSVFDGTGIMEGSDTRRKRSIVTYGHPRTQGSDRPVARAAGCVSVLQRGGRHDLRGQG